MKITISTEKFNDINGIKWRDGYDATWCDWQSYGTSQLAEISEYTIEQLEQSPALFDVLNRAYNRAQEQSVAYEFEKEQAQAYETFIERLEGFLNDTVRGSCERGDIEGKISLTLTEKPDVCGDGGTITIEGDAVTLAKMTIEIINGEGMFRYDSVSEFARVMNGKYAPARAVEHHLHYLLNAKLICDIWGERYRDIQDLIDDRAISHAYPDDETIKEAVAFEMSEADDTVRDEILALKYV